MPIKFLFINAINSSKEIETKYPPLGIGYLVSSLRSRFGIDAIEFKVADRDIENEIINFKPDLVGISSVSQNYNKALGYSKLTKQHGLPVICGGVHISMLPSTLAKEMDIGVIGEGEGTLCELTDLYLKSGSFPKDELRRINGIIYWDDQGKLSVTGKRELIYPLDTIPLPARDLFKIQSSAYMFTSRGCPYRCFFCASSRYWDKVRFFSAEYVVNEISHLINAYNVKEISFQDDLFMCDTGRISRIISLLRQRGLLGKVAFYGAARANLVNEQILSTLAEMGVKSIGIGFESGCDETLKYLKGDNVSIEDNKKAIELIKKSGLLVAGSFIIGSPRESRDDILKTLGFIKKNRMDRFGVYVLTPFPGTPVWDYAASRGLVSENMDWDTLNVNFEENSSRAIILSEILTRKEIFRLFSLFTRYKKMINIRNLILHGLRNPLKIPGFLIRKIAQREGE